MARVDFILQEKIVIPIIMGYFSPFENRKVEDLEAFVYRQTLHQLSPNPQKKKKKAARVLTFHCMYDLDITYLN